MLIREISLETRLRKKLQLGNFFFSKRVFFVNMDVYFQNMAIRSCDYASQGAIKSQKVIV